MGILLAFVPFLVFAVADRIFGATIGLSAGAVVAAAMTLRDVVTPGRSPKVLEIGTVILFGGLAAYALLAAPDWSLFGVRLAVDGGLLLIVLVSIAIRRPFTLQYAREQVAREFWASPTFLRTNDIITLAWALAFVVMVAADIVLLYVPGVPPAVGIVATVAALYGAIKFTAWYPKRVRASLAGAKGVIAVTPELARPRPGAEPARGQDAGGEAWERTPSDNRCGAARIRGS